MCSFLIEQECIQMNQPHQLPETGFLRIKQIVGDVKRGIPALIPVKSTTWWNGVKSGRFPKPVKLGLRTTAWRVEDIRDLIAKIGGVA
jgi:predicted DNA-binding transcriptional regulator AlpA